MKVTEMLAGDRFFLRGNEYEVVTGAKDLAQPLVRRICDGATLTVDSELEPLLESYRRGATRLDRMQEVAVELKQFSDDEGRDALLAKFDRWISTLEELMELRIPGLGLAVPVIKELHRMCCFNGALDEYARIEIPYAEWETILAGGEYTVVGSNEGGYSMTCKHTPDEVYWDADAQQAYRMHRR